MLQSNPNQEITLCRVGDFYEAFGGQAKDMAKILNITLAKRNGVAMAGVPAHSLAEWVDKLTAEGRAVVIVKTAA